MLVSHQLNTMWQADCAYICLLMKSLLLACYPEQLQQGVRQQGVWLPEMWNLPQELLRNPNILPFEFESVLHGRPSSMVGGQACCMWTLAGLAMLLLVVVPGFLALGVAPMVCCSQASAATGSSSRPAAAVLLLQQAAAVTADDQQPLQAPLTFGPQAAGEAPAPPQQAGGTACRSLGSVGTAERLGAGLGRPIPPDLQEFPMPTGGGVGRASWTGG